MLYSRSLNRYLSAVFFVYATTSSPNGTPPITDPPNALDNTWSERRYIIGSLLLIGSAIGKALSALELPFAERIIEKAAQPPPAQTAALPVEGLLRFSQDPAAPRFRTHRPTPQCLDASKKGGPKAAQFPSLKLYGKNGKRALTSSRPCRRQRLRARTNRGRLSESR